MKRSELKVGEAYYYDSSKSWADAAYSRGEKAVVVDDKRYTIVKSTWSLRREERYREDPKGTAVLVDLHRDYRYSHVEETRVERTVVLAAHLRGPWEETVAEVTARSEERQRKTAAEQKQREETMDRAANLVDRAKTLGITVDGGGYRYGRNVNEVTISVDEFEKLLNAYEKYAGKE